MIYLLIILFAVIYIPDWEWYRTKNNRHEYLRTRERNRIRQSRRKRTYVWTVRGVDGENSSDRIGIVKQADKRNGLLQRDDRIETRATILLTQRRQPA